MSQTIYSTEGIVLRVIPFREYDQIISIFTPEAGVIKVMYKGSRNKRNSGKGVSMPLTKVEVVYREKKGEIFSCFELNCIEMFPSLRTNLSFLETACDLLQVITDSQFMGKGAPQLYALLCYYLKKISQTADPWLLATSFRLKLLKHDGLVGFPLICSECSQLLRDEAFTQNGEGWCTVHQPRGSQKWDLEELHVIYRLAESLSYQEICSLEISSALQRKINYFFRGCLQLQA